MRRALVLAMLAAALGGCAGDDSGGRSSPPAAPADPNAWLQDVAKASGLDFTHVSGHRERPYFPEIMGGGGALFDMDGDGDLDAYLVQSGSLYEPGSEAARNRLFRNRGDGTFEDVTDGSGADDRGYGMGVAVGDHDDDGDPDLYVTNYGPNVLLRNDGDGRFTDVTDAAGVGDDGWGVSAAFVDLDADGDLDLFLVNYVVWSMETELDCKNSLGELDYCLPTNYQAPGRDTLYRNDGGTFVDASESAGLGAAFGYGLGTVCTDFDGDGLPDIFVANDSVFNQLWMNQGGLVFEEDALLRGCAVDEDGFMKAGMGVMAIDYDDDGDRDLLVVNLERQSDSYYENDGGFFSDRSAVVGLGAVSRRFTRFGAGFHDFDDDGWLDLYLANGRVLSSPEPEGPDPYAEVNLLLRGGPDRKLTEVSLIGGTSEPLAYTSRGAAFGDVDGDGGVDVLVVNRDGPAQLLRNVKDDRGNWIAFRVRERSGRNALGAIVEVKLGDRTISRDVISAYSYIAASDPAVHVGLGEAAGVDEVTVRWVDGEEQSFGALEGGRMHELRRR